MPLDTENIYNRIPRPYRRDIVAWIGIIGASTSIVGNIEQFIQLSHIIDFAIKTYNDFLFGLWNLIFNLFEIRTSYAFSQLISALLFVALIAVRIFRRFGVEAHINYQLVVLYYALSFPFIIQLIVISF